MTPAPIRAVLFDFGGVIADEGFRDGLRALARAQGLDPERVHRDGIAAVYDTGFVLGRGSEADFWALMRARSGLAGADAELTAKVLRFFVVRPRMIALVQRLRARGQLVAILSDQTHWLDALDRRTPFKHLFDRVYNSYYLGKGKRDPSLFADVANDLGLPPVAMLFVDDDPGNIGRARRAGYRTLLFTDEASGIVELERRLG